MSTTNKKKVQNDTRKKILKVAGRLFAEKGYNNTSVRDIAAELGIANPSLYYHFKSKREILQELMLAPMEIVATVMLEAQQLEGEARLRRTIEGLLEALEAYSGIAITALRDGGQLTNEQRGIARSAQPQIRVLLAQDTSPDNQQLRLTMAIGAVQAAVSELMHQTESSEDFITQLRANRDAIVELAISVLVS